MNFTDKKKNILLLIVCCIVYFSCFLLKYSFTANIISIEAKYHVPHSETGLVSSLFLISYGIGQFVNGSLVRRYKIKYVLPGSILASCILNLLFILTPVGKFNLIKIYWFLNGVSMSLLWPCIVRFYVENVTEDFKEKGIFYIGCECALATGLAYAISSLFTAFNSFIYVFIIGIIIGIICIACWFIFYPYVSSPSISKPSIDEKIETKKAPLHFIVYVGLCVVICIVATFARDGVINWAPSILNENFHVSSSFSVLITVLLPIAQFLGVCLASFTKRFVKSHILLCSIYFGIAFVCLGIGYFFNYSSVAMIIVLMILSVICSSAPIHIVCDILPVAWSKERNSGLFAGIFNGCCYVGAASAAFGLSLVADNYSWNSVFVVITFVYLSALLIAIGYYFIRALLFRFTSIKKF